MYILKISIKVRIEYKIYEKSKIIIKSKYENKIK